MHIKSSPYSILNYHTSYTRKKHNTTQEQNNNLPQTKQLLPWPLSSIPFPATTPSYSNQSSLSFSSSYSFLRCASWGSISTTLPRTSAIDLFGSEQSDSRTAATLVTVKSSAELLAGW